MLALNHSLLKRG